MRKIFLAGKISSEYAAASIAVLAGISVLLWWSGRGLDLTDEAYYLAWTADPAQYSATIHPFGIFFNFALWKIWPSIFGLRAFGILLLAVATVELTNSARRYYISRNLAAPGPYSIPLCVLFSLSYYLIGVVTPSYNLLANVGGVIFAAGLFRWFTRQAAGTAQDDIGSVLVGLGAFLAFLGKPTLAVAAAIVVGVIIVTDPPRSVRRAVIVAVACLTPLLVFLASTVGIANFLGSVGAGFGVLDFGNSLPRLIVRAPNELYHAPAYLAVAVAAVTFTAALGLGGDRPRPARLLQLGLIAYLVLSLIFEVVTGLRGGRQLWVVLGAPILALNFGATSAGMTRSPEIGRKRSAVIPLLALPVLSLCTSFGSANPWLDQLGASLFPLFLSILLSAHLFQAPRVARATGLALGSVVLGGLLFTIHAPYRLATGIAGQNRPITLPFSSTQLLVDAPTATYAAALRSSSINVTRETLIVDLSNEGPGTALLMGGHSPWFPWLNANYANAVRLADAAWQSVAADQRAAVWFVGPLAPALRTSRAASYLEANRARYVLAGQLVHPQTGHPIEIWKPVR